MFFWKRKKSLRSTIYLIDDDQDILETYEDFIDESFKEIHVKKFTNIKDAVNQLAEEAFLPSLIVCDIRLPDESGLKIFDLLEEKHYHVPVHHISGLGGEDIHTEKYHILSKPISSHDFISSIQLYLVGHKVAA